MATQFEIECALMAGRAYQTNRADINQFPVPNGCGIKGVSFALNLEPSCLVAHASN